LSFYQKFKIYLRRPDDMASKFFRLPPFNQNQHSSIGSGPMATSCLFAVADDSRIYDQWRHRFFKENSTPSEMKRRTTLILGAMVATIAYILMEISPN
jgi:hypothetical protein